MVATGMTQGQISHELGVSRPAAFGSVACGTARPDSLSISWCAHLDLADRELTWTTLFRVGVEEVGAPLLE